MIVFGYKSDNIYKLPNDYIEVLDGFEDVELFTGYSCSAYEPEAAVFGIQLSHRSSLFNPLNIADLRLEPTDAERKELAEAWDLLSEEITHVFVDCDEPRVMIFENTDD